MTRSQFTGYEIAKNLSEADSPDLDTSIIDNLGGPGISNDLLLFYNNLRNFSSVDVSNTNVVGDTISIPSKDFVFTNGTRIEVNGSVYYVKDYDSVNKFKLSTDKALSSTVSVPPTGTYVRSDAVTLDNIKMLSKERKLVLTNIIDSTLFVDLNLRTEEEKEKLYTSIIAMINSTEDSVFPSTISNYFSGINQHTNKFNYYENNSLIRNKDFSINKELVVDGYIRIVDTAGLNNLELLANSNPGSFITNPFTGVSVRSFLSNENIWSTDGTYLVSSAPVITVGSLSFTGNNGIEFNEKTPGIIVTEIANTANIAFTHTIDITIDGEIYSLCLIEEP